MKFARRMPAMKPVRSDLTPMIDVTFLILIFFMLTIRFRTLEGKLDSQLPKQQGVNPAHSDPVVRARIVIEVLSEGTRLQAASDRLWDGQGPFRFGSDRRLRYSCGPRSSADLAVVRAYLHELRRLDPDTELVVDSRGETVYADAIAVIDMASALGYQTIALAGASR